MTQQPPKPVKELPCALRCPPGVDPNAWSKDILLQPMKPVKHSLMMRRFLLREGRADVYPKVEAGYVDGVDPGKQNTNKALATFSEKLSAKT